MFPFCFEWAWDVGHLLFMGLLYMVLGAITTHTFFSICSINWGTHLTLTLSCQERGD
jgi:hypothetical protein